MIKEINNILLQSILLEDNAIIKNKERLEEYLNDFESRKLTNFISPYAIQEKDNKPISDFVKMKEKKELIEYISNNYEKIIEFYITILEPNELEFIKEIAKKGTITFSLQKPKISLKFVIFLKEFAFLKVYYDEKEEKITVFIPSSYKKALEKGLKDEKNLKANQKFNEICNIIIGMLKAYAVIPFQDMYKILRKFFNISPEKALKALQIKSLTDDIININTYKKKLYISIIEFFTAEEAYNFYKEQKGKYKKLTYKEYTALRNDKYLEMLPSYKKLFNYLKENYDIKDGASFEICKIFLINDYLVHAQKNEQLAKEEFLSCIDEFFEMDKKEKEKVYKLMHSVYDEYPKWIKRGNK